LTQNGNNDRQLAGVKEGPAECVRIDEVAAALQKMNSGALEVKRGIIN